MTQLLSRDRENNGGLIPLEQLRHAPAFELRGGKVLYHVGRASDSEPNSACGLFCCSTYMENDEVIKQDLSRVGGVLTTAILGKEKSHLCGMLMTTGREVLQYAFEPTYWLKSIGDSDQVDQDVCTYADENADSDSDSDSDSATDISALPCPTVSVTALAIDWQPVEIVATNFLHAWTRQETSAPAMCEYTLMKPRSWPQLENKFTIPGTSGQSQTIDSYCADDELTAGPLSIVMDGSTLLRASLVSREIYWTLPTNTTIRIRKIELKTPLAHGTNGLWLVRGTSFCGMVVARVPECPIAYIITAEQIINGMAMSDLRPVGVERSRKDESVEMSMERNEGRSG
ncbi:hypothetical protein CORC01_12968 [Colletotrichum orchidophilum]|uniref:Uncharacterized protein n=1 Tax=Colletotrichum orchidophilum TaxID=1209926 RepID=A0A1G4ARK9_9PEZI|nr:uncharacterized protein CORC01_12968 [Colletotrichum orchidophilum]OHE91741.1 hypothetical protein CORC01_12968 [Colletotrichum orchidophilum]